VEVEGFSKIDVVFSEVLLPFPYLICLSQLEDHHTCFVPIPLAVHTLWRIFHLPGLGSFPLVLFLALC
jgi:hypothetical protein